MSSSTIRSSTSNDPTAAVISVLRSLPCFSETANSSSLRIPIRRSSDPKIPRRSSISSRTSVSSISSFSISRPVRRDRRISSMALACNSESSNRSRSSVAAIFESFEPRMTLMTSSMLSTAILSPSRWCSRERARWRSNSLRRTMTSCR